MLEKDREEHELFMTKMKREIQANKDELRYLKAVKDTQSDVVIANIELTSIASKPTENVMRHPRRTRPWSQYYCDWCDLDDHNDSRCWLKHPEAPKWWPEKYKDQIERYRRKNQGNNGDNEQDLIGNRPALAQSTTALEATKDKVTNWQPAEITVEPAKCQVVTYELAEITNQPKAVPDESVESKVTAISHTKDTELAISEKATREPTETTDEPAEFISAEIRSELAQIEVVTREPEEVITNWQPTEVAIEPTKCQPQVIPDEPAQMTHLPEAITIELVGCISIRQKATPSPRSRQMPSSPCWWKPLKNW